MLLVRNYNHGFSKPSRITLDGKIIAEFLLNSTCFELITFFLQLKH